MKEGTIKKLNTLFSEIEKKYKNEILNTSTIYSPFYSGRPGSLIGVMLYLLFEDSADPHTEMVLLDAMRDCLKQKTQPDWEVIRTIGKSSLVLKQGFSALFALELKNQFFNDPKFVFKTLKIDETQFRVISLKQTQRAYDNLEKIKFYYRTYLENGVVSKLIYQNILFIKATTNKEFNEDVEAIRYMTSCFDKFIGYTTCPAIGIDSREQAGVFRKITD